MATAYTFKFNTAWAGESIMAAPIETLVRPDPVAEELSGVEINQNGALSGTITMKSEKVIWQAFRFPADYPRGVSGGSITIPKLCGFHLNVEVEQDRGPVAGLDWYIDYYQPSKGWTGIVKGTEVGSPGDGSAVWFDVNFTPIDITNFWWHKFRLGIRGRVTNNYTFREPVEYNTRQQILTIQNEVIPVIPDISASPLIDGHRYFFNFEERPSIIEMIGGSPYFSEQHGITNVLYTSPNPFKESSSTEFIVINANANNAANEEFERIEDAIPFATPRTKEGDSIVTIPRIVGSDIKAYESDGVTSFVEQIGENVGQELSLRFRILSTAPDSDRDCTGSLYRTVALVSDPKSVKTSVGDLEEAYWLSGPNPSQFACESLYIDISENGEATVVDHLVIDPVTPGIYMNVYYSNDPTPGATTEEWDGLLWTPVPKQFLLRRKESFALPEPITAKYVKLEFTHLQPIWYSAGTFQRPTQYRKHPQWVISYYLCLYEELRAATLEEATFVNVTFDALDLAYNYYLDDIRQDNPNPPTTVESAEGVSLLSKALTKAEEEEELQLDGATLAKINLSMQRFRQQPAQQGTFGSLLQRIVGATAQINNYPTEGQVVTTANTSRVSGLERDNVIIEKQFPITQFYLECRHYYAISEAIFEEDRAYFAGIKEVALTREHYATRFDNELYIDTAGDSSNIESNDLDTENNTYVTYTEQ